jgi:hypothetical protein
MKTNAYINVAVDISGGTYHLVTVTVFPSMDPITWNGDEPGASFGFAPIQYVIQSDRNTNVGVYGFHYPTLSGSLSNVKASVKLAERIQAKLRQIEQAAGTVKSPSDFILRIAAVLKAPVTFRGKKKTAEGAAYRADESWQRFMGNDDKARFAIREVEPS